MAATTKHHPGKRCLHKRAYVISLSLILFFSTPLVVHARDLGPAVPGESTIKSLEQGRVQVVAQRAGLESKGKRPAARFSDTGDGTIRDNLTGLIWLKNANCFGAKTWDEALAACGKLAAGDCGLADGSSVGDWRLPTVKDLQSLIDFNNYDPALPKRHPFTEVQSSAYWSATEYVNDDNYAWHVYSYFGGVTTNIKSGHYYVWPVRGDLRRESGFD